MRCLADTKPLSQLKNKLMLQQCGSIIVLIYFSSTCCISKLMVLFSLTTLSTGLLLSPAGTATPTRTCALLCCSVAGSVSMMRGDTLKTRYRLIWF